MKAFYFVLPFVLSDNWLVPRWQFVSIMYLSLKSDWLKYKDVTDLPVIWQVTDLCTCQVVADKWRTNVSVLDNQLTYGFAMGKWDDWYTVSVADKWLTYGLCTTYC